MNGTPSANRKHIGIYGRTNAGKSELLNAIVGQDVSLVSHIEGTTTDPVVKAMEFIPLGPVVFIDTAGFGDESRLGKMRVERTLRELQRTDLALYIIDINKIDIKSYEKAVLNFKKHSIPYITVINKIDTINENTLKETKEKFPEAIFVSAHNGKNILELKGEIIKKIQDKEEEFSILGDLLPYGSKIIMVVPIDSEAPKGRIILPQVQCIRDALDHGIKSYVVRDTELEEALKDIKNVDLVITDSQAFKKVANIVPNNIKLTSFSILFARHKGDLETFVQGVKHLKNLGENSNILIWESCTHNTSHEDIGRVKIPKMITNQLGKKLNFEFKSGQDVPKDLTKYDLVIHCGSCMLTRKNMINRINMCKEKGINITNYGVVIAYLTGILDRSLELFF